MKKLLTVCGLVVALISLQAFNAEAVSIYGAISFSGTSIHDNEDLTLATAFTEFSNVVVSSTGGTEAIFRLFPVRLPRLCPSRIARSLHLLYHYGRCLRRLTYSFDAQGLSSATAHTTPLGCMGPASRT